MKAVINADDFGMSETVSQAIAFCFDQGIVSNTTIMANMPGAEYAKNLAQEHGFMHCVGLHLNLTTGTPMTEPIKSLPLLCDKDGQFAQGGFSTIQKATFLPKHYRNALSTEIEAQMRWYIEAGFPQMHMDSHQGVHTWNAILSVIPPLARRFGFKTMRHKEISQNRPLPIRCYASFINRRMPNYIDYFCDASSFPEVVTLFNPQASYELMTHPTFLADKCIDALTGAPMDNLAKTYWLELISYGAQKA